MKSNFVSSGTIRRRRTAIFSGEASYFGHEPFRKAN
jgi:hypothetical protein